MANNIDIKIQIKEAGFELIEDLRRRLRNLAGDLKQSQEQIGLPVEKIAESFRNFSDAIASIKESIKGVESIVRNVISSIRSQSDDLADSTVSRVGETADQAVETLYSRAAVFFAGLGTVATLYVSQVFGRVSSSFPIFFGYAKAIAGQVEIFSKQLFSLDGLSRLITPRVEGLYNVVTGVNASVSSTLNLLSGTSFVLTSILGAATGFFAFKIFFSETTLLVRRLLGMGMESLTPIERATRLLGTVDQSVHTIGINAGILMKSAVFGIATFFGPFQGIIAGIPFINSMITTVLQFFQRGRLSLMAWLGSSRAQVGLIVFDLKTLLIKVLPDLLKAAKDFGPAITGLAKMPQILKQGMDAVANLQKLFSFVLAEIIKVANLLQKTFTVTKAEVASIGDKAKSEVSDVQKKIEAVIPKRKGSLVSFDKFQGIPESTKVAQANDALNKQAQVIRVTTQDIEKYKTKISELLGFEGMLARKQGGQSQFGKDIRAYFVAMITSAFGSSLSREFSQEHLNKTIGTFLAKAFAFTGSIQGSRDLAQKVAKTINDSIAEAGKLGVTAGPVIGKSVMRVISAGLDPGASPELKIAATKILTGITGFLQSAITRTKESGKQINTQIAQGMQSAVGNTNKAAKAVAQGIKDYFPGSIARLMPLRGLISSGFQIPFQLAQGMQAGLASVTGAAKNIASAISSEIERNIKIFNISASVGISVEKISAFQSALSALGAGSEDLTFVFTKLNESINKGLTEEDLNEYKKLGINIDQVRQATDPTLTLFLELSEILKKSTPGSDAYRKALEMLGTTASSGLVPALKAGKDELKRLANESIDSGFVVTSEFAKVSKDTKIMFDTFERFRNSIVDIFLSGLLPALNKVGSDIVSFFKRHSIQIQGFVGLVANILGETIKLASTTVQEIFKNPGLALEVSKRVLVSVFNFMLSSFENFKSNLSVRILVYLQAVGSMVLNVPISFAKNLFEELLALSKNQIERMTLEILHTFTRQFEDSPSVAGQVKRTILKKIGLGDVVIFADELNKNYDGLLNNIGRKSLDTGQVVGSVIKTAKDEYDKVVASTKDVAIVSPEVFQKLKADFEDLTKSLTGAISGTPFEAVFKDFGTKVDDLLQGYTEKLREQRAKIKQEVQNIEKPLVKPPGTQAKGWWDSWGKDAESAVSKTGESASQLKEIFSNLYEFSGKKKKEYLIAMKAMTIGEIILNAAAATMKAIATAPHVAFGIVQAAIIAALAGTQIAKVTMQKFFGGGQVEGEAGIDRVPARLTPGEFVLPTWSVRKYGLDAMEGLRQNLFPEDIFENFSRNFRSPAYVPKLAYATGGPVMPPMSQATQEQKQSVNVVNLIDPRLFEAYLASSSGERMVMNVLHKNKNEARQIIA